MELGRYGVVASPVASKKMGNPQLVRAAGDSELASPRGFEPQGLGNAKSLS
jgi:hypothetical protein